MKKITGLKIYYWDIDDEQITIKADTEKLKALLGDEKNDRASDDELDEFFFFDIVDDSEFVLDVDDYAMSKEMIEIGINGSVIVENEYSDLCRSKREYFHALDVQRLLEKIGDVESKLDPKFSETANYEEADCYYKIIVDYDDDTRKKMSGKCLRPDLPKNWLVITAMIKEFLEDIDELCVLLTRRYFDYLTTDETVLVNVYFKGSKGPLYTYIADVDIGEGAVVIVPVGENNKDMVAIVDSVEIVNKADIKFGFQLKKVKEVIGNIFDEDYDD